MLHAEFRIELVDEASAVVLDRLRFRLDGVIERECDGQPDDSVPRHLSLATGVPLTLEAEDDLELMEAA